MAMDVILMADEVSLACDVSYLALLGRKLEMIQRRAARVVYADYQTTSSVSTMLNQLQWTTLQERRATWLIWGNDGGCAF
jgi:hypothetical protein